MDELSLCKNNKSRRNHSSKLMKFKENLNINDIINENLEAIEEDTKCLFQKCNPKINLNHNNNNSPLINNINIINDRYSRRNTVKTNLLLLSTTSSNIINNDTNYSTIIKKIRKDAFGRDIIKGGNMHISFADEVEEKIRKRAMNEKDDFSMPRRRKHFLPDIKQKGRKTASYINERPNEHKRKRNKHSFYISPLINIILIENYKKETRKMSFTVTTNTPGKEIVCCSKTCSVF